jgi:DNA-binding transcriptional LysR family regulator
LLTMLLAGKIELALAYNFALTQELEAQPLAELPPYVVVSAAHRLAQRRSISLRELASEPFVLLDLPYSRDYFFGLFQTVGVEPRVVFRTRSQELIRGLVAHGHGYGIQNAIAATSTAYDGGEIAALAIEEKLPPTRIMCVRLKQNSLRPAVEAFAAFLRESFAPGGPFAPGSITAPRVGAVQRL